jgi:hypothetical protein
MWDHPMMIDDIFIAGGQDEEEALLAERGKRDDK